MYKFIEKPQNYSGIKIPRLNYSWGEPLEILYPDYIVRFSLHYAIGRMDLNGKPIDNSDEYFPTGYNNELAKLIDKYLEQ